jgi:hypothetical protein
VYWKHLSKISIIPFYTFAIPKMPDNFYWLAPKVDKKQMLE